MGVHHPPHWTMTYRSLRRRLVKTMDNLFHAFTNWREIVLKPIYSRFATRTQILVTLKQASATLKAQPNSTWVAQAYMRGTGDLHIQRLPRWTDGGAHCVRSTFTAGQGAAIVFQHIDHPAIFNWVRTFVARNHFTGQIAFDFIQTA